MPSTPIISLPSNFISSVFEIVTNIFTSLSPVITLILGVVLAVYAIGAILSWIKH